MSVLLVTHESSWEHRNPPGHPERVERLDAVLSGVRESDAPVIDLTPTRVDRDLLRIVHTDEYIEEVERLCLGGGGSFDQDTFAVAASFEAALFAAGTGPSAIDAIGAGDATTAFIAVRPPGHHAERSCAMGFCLFNNIAVAAAYLRNQGERIAIIDWDVHHGNGTQNTFYRDPDVLYVSLHEFPFYPGTGWIDEQGDGRGEGTTVNVPLPAGTSADSYLAAFRRIVDPIVEQFAPDWILVSNGYDAHRRDPIGGLRLESEHYGWLTDWATGRTPESQCVLFLEGGYDLDALAESSKETVDALAGRVTDVTWPSDAEGSASRMVDLAIEAHARHWELR